MPARRDGFGEAPRSASLATGVRHKDEAFSVVAVSRSARAENSCLNAVAQSLQWRDEGGELPVDVPRDVLAEETERPALGNDAHDLIDEEAIIVRSAALSRN